MMSWLWVEGMANQMRIVHAAVCLQDTTKISGSGPNTAPFVTISGSVALEHHVSSLIAVGPRTTYIILTNKLYIGQAVF